MLDQIQNQMNHLEAVRNSLYEVKKLQLHTGLEGFNSPSAYATYKSSGGNALGVVGQVYEPIDLYLLMDSLTASFTDCGTQIKPETLSFREQREGARCQMEVNFQSLEIKGSPMKGDVVDQKLILRTGFDGLTKTSLSFHTKRLWCTNGAASWQKDVELSLKNTVNNHIKLMMFCDEIMKVQGMASDYVDALGRIAANKVGQAQIDAFLTKLTGFDVSTYKDMTTKRRNILDRINESVAIEAQNTGWNEFSLLQGITRYTTHDLCGGDPYSDALFYDNAAKISQTAHALLLN